MTLETSRLILRPWREEDAESLFRYASDPAVGPIAGWPPHTDVEHSRQIIRTVFSAAETYAVVLKKDEQPVGSIGLISHQNSSLTRGAGQAELGYWIGRPFWGQGLIPEAANALLRRGFEELGLTCIWGGYFDGNERSRRVMEKCGFVFHHTEENVLWELTGQSVTQHVTLLTKKHWCEGR